jgi:LPXTG-motif cell wall-anchored protein
MKHVLIILISLAMCLSVATSVKAQTSSEWWTNPANQSGGGGVGGGNTRVSTSSATASDLPATGGIQDTILLLSAGMILILVGTVSLNKKRN